MNMIPRETVAYLDNYIIGQDKAKRTIALALRNRHRRMQLSRDLQEEIMPKNILMIGSTGVGKTEISRRLAKMMNLPFIKVEASKFTEVGFVGRDVESMIRDLVITAIAMLKDEHNIKNASAIEAYVINKIVDKLLPPLPSLANETKQEEYKTSRERMKEKVLSGAMDTRIIEIDLPKINIEFNDTNMSPDMAKVQESFSKMFSSFNKENAKKETTVKDAKEILKHEASSQLLDNDAITKEALTRVEQGGIVFLDEIDKIAVSAKSEGRNDPSKEGVQRDLLPIVEGSTVTTKYGAIKTDHILFIAAGAFHKVKPSDLIPELQGRFPLRVELESLTEEVLYKILSQTKNSLLRQYEALLGVEDVQLTFDESAIKAMAHLAQKTNEKTEDIGARRLHTILEKVLEDISFDADLYCGQKVVIDADMVHEKLDIIIEDEDTSRYIL
jgi:ATP-dependent HslUV protease ATP-binding subunit HslU